MVGRPGLGHVSVGRMHRICFAVVLGFIAGYGVWVCGYWLWRLPAVSWILVEEWWDVSLFDVGDSADLFSGGG